MNKYIDCHNEDDLIHGLIKDYISCIKQQLVYAEKEQDNDPIKHLLDAHKEFKDLLATKEDRLSKEYQLKIEAIYQKEKQARKRIDSKEYDLIKAMDNVNNLKYHLMFLNTIENRYSFRKSLKEGKH